VDRWGGGADLSGKHDVVWTHVVENDSGLTIWTVLVGEDHKVECVRNDLEGRLLRGSPELLHERHHIVDQLHRVQCALRIEHSGHHSLLEDFKVGATGDCIFSLHDPSAHDDVAGADHVLSPAEILNPDLEQVERRGSMVRREGQIDQNKKTFSR
jgi:hypothetical protein